MKVFRGLIGTFHKTGTVLLKSILEQAAAQGLLGLWQVEAEPEPEHWNIGFSEHSTFSASAFAEPHRFAIVVRDPRDVVISGAHYHCRADEAWLNTAESKLDGKSYREAISSLSSDDERFLFEMEHAAGETIRHMVEVASSSAKPLLIKYEALVSDTSLAEFKRLFSYVGLDGRNMNRILQISRDNSLFSGVTSNHVRNGLAEQWKRDFSPDMKVKFAERFDRSAILLGYEPTANTAG